MTPPFNPYTELHDWNAFNRRALVRGGRWWRERLTPLTPPQLGLMPTPYDVVKELGRVRLLHFPHPHDQRDPALTVPVLLVPSIINKYYVFDLRPGCSMVAYLQARGFDVWLVDWGVPRREDRFDTLEIYITTYLRRLLMQVKRSTGQPASILGYSAGGVFTTIAAAIYPELVANLINLTGPIDFRDDGLFHAWTQPDNFDPRTITAAYGNMPGWLMNLTFDGLVPGKMIKRLLLVWQKLEDEQALRDYLALLAWRADAIDMAGGVYRDLVQVGYQENRLVQGELRVGETAVSLQAITCPVLTIAAKDDYIAPPESSLSLVDHVGSTDTTALLVDGGHIDIVTNRDASEKLFPQIADWLLPRSR